MRFLFCYAKTRNNLRLYIDGRSKSKVDFLLKNFSHEPSLNGLFLFVFGQTLLANSIFTEFNAILNEKSLLS
jgi:hypothetical protein